MGLFTRFRRRRRTEDYVGRHRPGSWGEVALPPAAPAPAVTSVEEPLQTVTAAPAPAVVAAPAPPPLPPPPPLTPPPVEVTSRQRVRLGFADGTSVDIDDASGDSDVFRRAAARLIDDPR